MVHHKIPKKRSSNRKIKWVDPELGRPNPNAPDPSRRNNPVKRKDVNQKEPQRLMDLLSVAKHARKRRPKKSEEEKKLAKKMANRMVIHSGLQNQVEAGMSRSLPPVPEKIEQGPYESKYQFLKRIDKMAEEALLEAKFIERYELDPYGKVEDVPKPDQTKKEAKDDEESPKESIRKNKQKQRAKQRRERKRKAKQQKQDDEDDFAHLKDEVKFGEVAERPPQITKAQKLTDKIAKAQKAKLAQQARATEQERINAVTMYRHLKKQKQLDQIRQDLLNGKPAKSK